MELLETRHAPSTLMIVGDMIDQSADPGLVEQYTLEPPPLVGVDSDLAASTFANLPHNHEFTASIDDRYFIAFGQDEVLRVADADGNGWIYDFDAQEWQAIAQRWEKHC